MLRRPSYRQFLNQTKEVQSCINLPLKDHSFSKKISSDSSKSFINPRQQVRQVKDKNWESKLREVVRYIPNDPRALRHTYVKESYGQSQHDSFSKSFQMYSPNRPHQDRAFAATSPSSCFRASHKQQPKKQVTIKPPVIQFTKCLSKPPNPYLGESKTLYQSKSSTKLGIARIQSETQHQVEKEKQINHRRFHNNANTCQKYQEPAKLQKSTVLIPKSSVHLSIPDDKQNKCLQFTGRQRKTHQDKPQIDKKDLSKSPIRATISPKPQITTFVPAIFKKKSSNPQQQSYNVKIVRQPSKSPLKRDSVTTCATNKTQSYLPSQSYIPEQSRHSTKPKSKPPKLGLNDFILGKKLGQGRFGVVWVAFHKLTGGIFALKKIAKSTIRSNFMIEQFMLQVKIQSFIENPYIVKLFGLFDDQQHIYILLEYLEGGTLYDFLKKKMKSKITEEEASRQMRMICQAVNCLHEKGIAHRDIKPENIIITNGVCKLADFGWATFCDERRKTYCGTTDYVAPQIVQGLQYDMNVDLWCIGILLYELLSGRAPFYHISRQQTFNKIKNVDSASFVYPEYFSPQAIDFIGNLIKKNPNDRMEMRQALKHPFITKYQL